MILIARPLGRGIGRAISLAFAQAGAHVALLARTKSQLDEVAEIITSVHQRKALVFPVDATDEKALAEAYSRTEQELGPVDIVIANAASFVWRPFVYTPFDEWWRMMEVNVKGPMFLTQLGMKSMRARNSGVIIIISSRAGLHNRGSCLFSRRPKVKINGLNATQLDYQHIVHPSEIRFSLVLIDLMIFF